MRFLSNNIIKSSIMRGKAGVRPLLLPLQSSFRSSPVTGEKTLMNHHVIMTSTSHVKFQVDQRRRFHSTSKAMGLNLETADGNSSFTLSYDGWYEIRRDTIRATFKYLQDKFHAHAQAYESDDEYDYFGLNQKLFEQMLVDMQQCRPMLRVKAKRLASAQFGNVEDLPSDMFDNELIWLNHVIQQKREYVDALNYFECGGLHVLCAANDHNGYYTPGNAMDIAKLYELIEPTLVATVSGEDLDWWYNNVKTMFNYAWEKRQTIMIR